MPQNQFLRINKTILQDKRLNATEKLILAYISGFIDNGKPFFASNSQIATFLGISRVSVIRSIKNLADYGFFQISHLKENGVNVPGNDSRIIYPKSLDQKPNLQPKIAEMYEVIFKK